MRNARLHARHHHFCYALSTQRWAPDTEAAIIPKKISIIPPQVSQLAKAKRQRHLRFGGSWGGIGEIGQDTDMRLWSEKPNGEESVTAWGKGLQVRKRSRMLGVSPRRSGIQVGCCTSCSRSWKRNKFKGNFTRMVSEGRWKPKLVVNIDVSKMGRNTSRVLHQLL